MFRALVLVLLFTAACSSSKVEKNGGRPSKPVPAQRVNWASVPSEFNPRVEDIDFRTDGAERIELDVFGFNKDVEVVYADMPVGTAKLRLFTVYKESATWGSLNPRSNGKTVNLTSYGSYSCSIRIVNGAITQLKGGCYVRLQLFLPNGAQVEAYNVGQLLTQRFIPMSNEELLKNVDRASWAEQKLAAINEYLQTYARLRRSPSLATTELKDLLWDIMASSDKLKALSLLHMHISDRANLTALLDREFSFRDREEARRITGL